MTELEREVAEDMGLDVSVEAILAKTSPGKSLRELVREAMTEDGLSQDRAGKEIGISGSALNQWLQDRYKGDNAAVERKIAAWLHARAGRAAFVSAMPAAPKWVSTPSAFKIEATLRHAQIAGDLAIIYGGAGVGKTRTITHYAQTNPNVWVGTITAGDAAIVPALEEVCESVGIQEPPMGARRMTRKIIERVRDSHGLLVVDEAQHLSVAALEQLRAIHDATGIGLVLSGNERVYAGLTGGKRDASFAQLFSRVGKRLKLVRPMPGDVDAIAEAFAIGGAKERQFLRQVALTPGALRAVVKCVRLAWMLAAGEGADLGAEHLRTAWADLGADV